MNAATQPARKENTEQNDRPSFDAVLIDIADYVMDYEVDSTEAYQTARYCLMDTLACGILALKFKACTDLLGPQVDGMTIPNGVRVPGTSYVLDPVKGAFDIGAMVRWLDYNDTWLAAEWGHPSDNLGAILAVSDFIRQKKEADAINKQAKTIKIGWRAPAICFWLPLCLNCFDTSF